jgi:hypothetical protein
MTLTMLGRLYFVLSCRLTPTDAPSVQHRRRVGSEATYAFAGSHLSLGVGSKSFWARLLVGFWCEDTCHVASSDPRSD